MPSKLNPYLSFTDSARQAMEFYKGVFGGNLTISTFKENNMSHGPADDNKVMHAMLEAPNGIVLMGADTPTGMEHKVGSSISISLSGEDHAELSGYYKKLSEGGRVNMPLDKAPWGDTFGMLTDKFGVDWMVNISGHRG